MKIWQWPKEGDNKGEKAGAPDKKKRGNRLGYFREVWLELKKVHWPTRQQLLTYTAVVLVSVGIVTVLIWIVDSGLSYALTYLLGS